MSIKPRHLKRNSLIGLVAPSFQFKKEILNDCIKKVESWGFRVTLGKNIFKKDSYFAGSALERANDMNAMFANKEVEAVWCVRGGYGGCDTINYLDPNIIKNNPKIFIGFSDITIIHNYFIDYFNWVTYHGPMVCTNQFLNLSKYDESVLLKTLTEPTPFGKLKTPGLKGTAVLEGKILGGNLSVIQTAIGTHFNFDLKDKLLFLEDTNEALYRIDRIVCHLRDSHTLAGVKGIILGSFGETTGVEKVISRALPKIPVYSNFPSGHDKRNITIPLNTSVRLSEKCIEYLESGTK